MQISTKRFLTDIKKANALSMDIFNKSIISFFNADMREAHKTIESISALERICGDISNMTLKQETIVGDLPGIHCREHP